MANEQDKNTTLIELAVGITESYVANNQMAPDQVPDFLEKIHRRLATLTDGKQPDEKELPKPPVRPEASVQKNDIVCLECGSRKKMLKRHLKTAHSLDEDTYKQRWGLPRHLKLVAKDYSQHRSNLAKKFELGKGPNKEQARKPGSTQKRKRP